MARLRALGLVASVILVLLCQSGSEAVRLAPTTPTTATPGNATASGGNAATSKPAGDPKGKTFHIVLGMGAEWGKRSKTTDYDTIVFENGGYIEVKRLYRFPSEEAYKKCNYKGATLLAKFQAAGEKYRFIRIVSQICCALLCAK
ncbi:unnamed protein product [Closterium sp. NIES-64]|nr:unnamed protein product [Closterium sp. NIES-64]